MSEQEEYITSLEAEIHRLEDERVADRAEIVKALGTTLFALSHIQMFSTDIIIDSVIETVNKTLKGGGE